jgi:hypothetical protein
MMRLGRQAWWSTVRLGACAAMIGAMACGGSESRQTERSR